LALLGILLDRPAPVAAAEPHPGEPIVELAFGGDVLLGAEMNAYVAQNGPAAPLSAVPGLRSADVTLVNLESVVAPGADAVDTGNVADHYFLGRPEMLGVLEAAGIDLVTTGNNHARDYGAAALAEEHRLLTGMGIAHPGIGSDLATACAPAYLASGGLQIAVISVNTAEPAYAAGTGGIGTCFVAPDDRDGWRRTIGPVIAEARSRADIVLALPHFRASLRTVPHPVDRAVARLLIDLGADAVLGDGAHALQGIEAYRGRPILHDAGSLVFNFPDPSQAAFFLLELSSAGVETVRTVPLVTEVAWTRPAEPAEASAILAAIDARSRQLGTQVSSGRLELAPPPRDPPTEQPPEIAPLNPGPAPGPLAEVPPVCTARSVPDGAAVIPEAVGPLTLIGARVDRERIDGPQLIWVETYWRIDTPVAGDLSIVPRASPEQGVPWQGPHEPCDWAWPTSRWAPGTTYRDRYPLRPTSEVLRLGGLPALLSMTGYGPLAISVEVRDRDRALGESGVVETVVLDPATRTRFGVLAGAVLAGLLVLALLRWWRLRQPRQA
jgi:hypothetical protein